MNTLNMSTRQEPVPFEGEATGVDLRDIQANDYVMLWTQKSVYSFLVTNKSYTFGKLWLHGKLLRNSREDQPADAVMLGAAVEPGDRSCANRSELRMNTRALFVIPFGGRAQRLLTSAITRVVVVKGENNLS